MRTTRWRNSGCASECSRSYVARGTGRIVSLLEVRAPFAFSHQGQYRTTQPTRSTSLRFVAPL